MKQIHLIIGTLAMLALSCATSYAWQFQGIIFCPSSGAAVPNVTINVTGTSCSGPLSGSTKSDANGAFVLQLPDCAGTYTACVDTTTLPAGDSITGNSCVTFSVDASNTVGQAVYTANCSAPPTGIIGTVKCSGGTPIPNVTINVTGTSCNGPINSSVTTDSGGNYFLSLPNCTGTYTACIDATTLPAGDTLIGGACTTVTLTPPNDIITINYTATCGPPPCPPCVDPSLGLGAASSTTVLELGASQVSINGPAGGILGNIYIAPGGKANFSGGGEYLTGSVFLGAGASYQNSGLIVGGSILKNQDLSAQINAAYAAAATAASLPCSQSFTTLDGKSVTKIVGNSGINVICVQNINIQGKQIVLTGPSDAKFIINITGQFVLNGGGAGPQIRVDASAGLTPSDVLYNVIGNGQDIQFNGGGGGVNCCAAIVDGTLLAPNRKIALAPGLVNGEIISAQDISIVSGSSVRCPTCQ